MSKVTWGIDIGESAVRAVKMRVSKTKAEVIAIDCIPRTFRAEGFNYVDKDEQVRAALGTLVRRNGIGSARVALAVPGAGFDRFISLPAVSLKQVPQIVKYEAKQQIPFPLEEVAWDYQPASADKPAPGEGIEVALFAIKNQIIQQMLHSMAVVGLGVDIIGMSRLSLYNVLKWDRQIGSGTMIIDIGPGSTDIVILADGNFRVRSIPIASDSVTKVLQQKFGIAQEEAEELKRKTMQSKQPDKMFGVMRPTFDRLLGEIHKTIGYYKQQFKTLKIEQAWLVGESFRMQPLVDLFHESLGCKVSVLSGFERITVASSAASSEYAKDLPSFAVAMGLALQAAGEGPVTINVLPPEIKLQREMSRKKPFLLAAAACLGIAVAAVFYGARGDSLELQRIGEKPESAIKKYEKLKKDYDEAKDTTKVEADIAGFADLGKNRGIMLEGLNELAKVYDVHVKDDKGNNIYLTKDIFLTKVTVTESALAQETEDEAPAEGEEVKAVVKPEVRYEMQIEGSTENDLKHVETNLVSLLKKVDIFTKNGKAANEEMPYVDKVVVETIGPAGPAAPGANVDANVRKRIVFTIKAFVTPREADVTPGDAK